MPNNSKQIAHYEHRLRLKQEQLDNLVESIRRDREALDLLKRTHTPPRPEKPKKQFLTLDCQDSIGLYNRPCIAPYAKCALHNCLLSYADVRRRKCVMKLCKHLEDLGGLEVIPDGTPPLE